MVKVIIIVACTTYLLMADVGCNILIEQKNQACQENSVLNQGKESHFESTSKEAPKIKLEHKTINITEKLVTVDTQHLEHEITIERTSSSLAPSCPPFCIEPIKIKGIETVGELELLAFIEEVKRKKDGLLIDVRKSSKYNEETIPSAINLPYEMLTKASPYQKEVLKTLGARKTKTGWFFKNPQKLLIFGESSFSPEASNAVKELLKLGYPKEKILYYRGGILSWKNARLTLI